MMRAPGPVPLGALAAAFYLFLQFQSDFLYDGDAYFHVKIAALTASGGPPRSLPWMSLAIHARRYVDYHFLYHCLLAPFTLVFDPVRAAKVAAACFAGFSAACFAFLLGRSVPRRYLWFWTLLFLCGSPIFTGRLMFGRATTLFLGLVFLFWFLLATRRLRLAGLCAAVSVWTYPGFPLLLVIAGLDFALGRARSGRWDLPALCYPLGGALAAFVLHPAFPAQFYGYYLEWIVHALAPAGLERIAEWRPPPPELAILALAAPGLLAALALSRRTRWTQLDMNLAGVALLLGLASMGAVKALEYLVPVLFALAALRWHSSPEPARKRTEAIGAAVLVAILALGLPELYRRTRAQARLMDPRPAFQAADWLAAHTRPGALVLLAWDYFPYFFFRNDRNRYLFGLNPVYAYGADRAAYQDARTFFRGEADPVALARRWPARYAVLREGAQGRVLERLRRSDAGRFVYAADGFFIFEFDADAGAGLRSGSPPARARPAVPSSP